MTVQELMNPKVITIEPSASAALAARLLSRYNVGSLPVCTPDRKLRGIVTDRDIVLRCVAPDENPSQVPVRSVMSRNPSFLLPEDDIRQAAQLMSLHQVRRLPVAEEGKLVGMLSLGDLARCGKAEMEVSRALLDISGNVKRI
jgi:CBS domain-containing protein